MSTLAMSRYAFIIGAAVAMLAGCSASHLPAAISPGGETPFAFTHHVTFRYTGKKQTFTVPRGVTRIRVIVVGAAGGGPSVIAHGSRVRAVIPVTPSETLAIYVGGAGALGNAFNGGGAGGKTRTSYSSNGGGGASDVREGGDALADRVVVAGGGGGQGAEPAGGDGGRGGARTGGSGKTGCCKRGDSGGTGGGGGTQSQGGSGGKGPDGAQNAGASGQLGIGGTGGTRLRRIQGRLRIHMAATAAGGGDDYYGGGGGGGGIFEGLPEPVGVAVAAADPRMADPNASTFKWSEARKI